MANANFSVRTICPCSFRELVEIAIEEVHSHGPAIKSLLKDHTVESVKPLARVNEDKWLDCGDWQGSALLFAMMCPALFDDHATGSILDVLTDHWDATWDLWATLLERGGQGQRSGEGPDNYRCNIVEALLGHVGVHHGGLRHVQIAWKWLKIFSSVDEVVPDPHTFFLSKSRLRTVAGELTPTGKPAKHCSRRVEELRSQNN